MESISQLGLAFFGLTSEIIAEVRKVIFTQIHEVVFYGKGGYSWYDVYNMPIWLRKFTHHKIVLFYQEEKESIKNAQSGNSNSKTLVSPDGKVNVPEFMAASPGKRKPPSYS